MSVAVAVEALQDVEVECTHCGIQMTAHMGSGQRIKYYRCGSCHRWVSSAYAEIFQADAKVRTRKPADEAAREQQFNEVKTRLERWLNALEEQDPYRTLGVSPMASPQQVKDRYRELAFRSHPDRGGSPDRMRELNLAYERVLNHQERRAAPLLNSPRGADLPASSR